VNISESESNWVIKADIPGVPTDALKVTLDNGVLPLQGERRQEQTASAMEGQLTVTVPKKAVTPSAKAVQVPVVE
jgi:HSP20 family protein